jgi:hypothetical protein
MPQVGGREGSTPSVLTCDVVHSLQSAAVASPVSSPHHSHRSCFGAAISARSPLTMHVSNCGLSCWCACRFPFDVDGPGEDPMNWASHERMSRWWQSRCCDITSLFATGVQRVFLHLMLNPVAVNFTFTKTEARASSGDSAIAMALEYGVARIGVGSAARPVWSLLWMLGGGGCGDGKMERWRDGEMCAFCVRVLVLVWVLVLVLVWVQMGADVVVGVVVVGVVGAMMEICGLACTVWVCGCVGVQLPRRRTCPFVLTGSPFRTPPSVTGTWQHA